MNASLQKLLERLCDPKKSGVYRVPDDRAVLEVMAVGKHDLGKVALGRGKDAMLQSIAESLEFPDWFDRNWDALEDCLTDLSWRDKADRVILISNAQTSDELGILLDVLASVAEFWRDQGRAFFVVFIDPDMGLKLPALYKE